MITPQRCIFWGEASPYASMGGICRRVKTQGTSHVTSLQIPPIRRYPLCGGIPPQRPHHLLHHCTASSQSSVFIEVLNKPTCKSKLWPPLWIMPTNSDLLRKNLRVQVYFSILGEHVDFYRNEYRLHGITYKGGLLSHLHVSLNFGPLYG